MVMVGVNIGCIDYSSSLRALLISYMRCTRRYSTMRRLLVILLLLWSPFVVATEGQQLEALEITEEVTIAFGIAYCANWYRIVKKDFRTGWKLEQEAKKIINSPNTFGVNMFLYDIYKNVREDVAYQQVKPKVVKVCESLLVDGEIQL